MTDPMDLHDLLADGTSLTVVCHNNPDPDCLASALALVRIAEHTGIDDHQIMYGGEISHQQNRAFVNLLDLNLTRFDSAQVRNRPDRSLLALVDHAIPGANNEVPAGTPIDIVIDHHPAENIEAGYVDHRETSGATATIMTEYVREFDLQVDTTLATALLIAIRSETLGFLRGVTIDEYVASGYLHDHADFDLLRKLSSPSVTGATIDAIADAIHNRTLRGSVLISHVGRTSERDALPQAADYLATLEGVDTAIVFGIIENRIQLSARSTDSRIHLGDVLNEAFADVGSAGGHSGMAGGEIPLGIFSDQSDDEDQLIEIVVQVVQARLMAGLNLTDTPSKSE